MARRLDGFTGKPPLAKRPLFSPADAADLAGLFRVLANDTRLRLLHALERGGELSVGDLAAAVAMTPQAVSNQLQRLADKRIVAGRRVGTRIFYRVVDPCVNGVLDLGICLAEETLQARASSPPMDDRRRGRSRRSP